MLEKSYVMISISDVDNLKNIIEWMRKIMMTRFFKKNKTHSHIFLIIAV